MSAWPEAIYTIKKVTADILAKHNIILTSMNSLNTNIGDLSGTVNTRFNALNTNLDNKFNTLGSTITLKQYVIASTTSDLSSVGYATGAMCFIREDN